MYIPIGLDFSVRDSAVIGVFDLDNTSWSTRTREFLAQAEKNGQAVDAADELPKSFVLTQEYGEQRVYLTRANAAVLQRRMAEE